MQSLNVVKNLVTQFDFICANSEQEKRQAYQLRFELLRQSSPNIAYIEQVIDPFDKDSQHILIIERNIGKPIATIRLSGPVSDATSLAALPCHAKEFESKSFISQVLNAGNHLLLSEISSLCIDSGYASDQQSIELITESAYLAAFSVARLRFDDRVLINLPNQEFKRLRARGLRLEHTSHQLGDSQQQLLWLSSENGIIDNSPCYELYQHVLDEIAQQLNYAQVYTNEYIVQEG